MVPDVYNHQVVDAGNAAGKDYFHIMAPGFTQDLRQDFEIDAFSSASGWQMFKEHRFS